MTFKNIFLPDTDEFWSHWFEATNPSSPQVNGQHQESHSTKTHHNKLSSQETQKQSTNCHQIEHAI